MVREEDGHRLLIVDDVGVVRTVVGRLLHRKGYSVTEARNVAAALEHLKRNHFDLVITDIRLSDGDGIDMIAGLDSPPKAIFMSGSVPSTTKIALVPGVNFITKPFRTSELTGAVERALNAPDDANEPSLTP